MRTGDRRRLTSQGEREYGPARLPCRRVQPFPDELRVDRLAAALAADQPMPTGCTRPEVVSSVAEFQLERWRTVAAKQVVHVGRTGLAVTSSVVRSNRSQSAHAPDAARNSRPSRIDGGGVWPQGRI